MKLIVLPLLTLVALTCTLAAQHPEPVPVPPLSSRLQPTPEPTSPPAQHVHDAREQLSFNLPVGWNLSRRDGDLSTFALDARSAPAHAQMHAVANLAFNPFPYSTFEGAIFYVAATPRSTEQACAAQAVSPGSRTPETIVLGGVPFQHGYSELGRSCVESRDEVYTAMRSGSCLRFDLVINTFCGESSGARDMTAGELAAVEHRLEGVLHSVHFESAPGTSLPGSAGGAGAEATR